MPPSTGAALVIVLLAIVPGALYTWTFEREAGSWGVTLADRTLRFLAVSVVFHLIAAWPEYVLWRYALAGASAEAVDAPRFAALWLAAVAMAGIPAALGTVAGGLYRSRTLREGWPRLRKRLAPAAETWLLRMLVGPEPAPRAWDDFFSERPKCYLRVRTTDGAWLAGKFAAESYAGGFPEEGDLLLEDALEVDEDTLQLGNSLGYPVYIRSGQIAWMEIIPESKEASDGTTP